MNYNLISQVTLLLSSIGLGFMVFNKIPVLSELSEAKEIKDKEALVSKIKKEIKIKNPLENIRYEDFLGRILKKVRMLFLETDNKIFSWSQKLKNESQKHKIEDDKDYWDRIKNNTNK